MDKKIERVINLYDRLVSGEIINKAEEAKRFGVNERTIQRDIDDLRAYLADDPGSYRELVYDRRKKGYIVLQGISSRGCDKCCSVTRSRADSGIGMRNYDA